MDEEKALIKRETKNILRKIVNFIKNIFRSTKKENNIKNINNVDTPIKNNSFIEAFQKENQLLNLQKKYELGLIKEEDLTEEERFNLVQLYKTQIESLQTDIDINERILAGYQEQMKNTNNN